MATVRSAALQSNVFVSWDKPKEKQQKKADQEKLFEDLKTGLNRIASKKWSFPVDVDSSQVLNSQFKKEFKQLVAVPDYAIAREYSKDFDRAVLSFLHQSESFCSQILEKLSHVKINLG